MTAARTVMPDRSPGDEWRIEVLSEAVGRRPGAVRGGALPGPLTRRYGPALEIGLRPNGPAIVANFVTTIDGVVAFDTVGETGGREVSGGFVPDRFLMGLLRSTADAVLVGAGTVRSGARHVWTPEHVYPPSAAAFAAWRTQLGLAAPQPTTVMVSGSGGIDPDHPALRRPDVPIVIVTTAGGARRLGSARLPPPVEVVIVEERSGGIDLDGLREVLVTRRLDLVVCEGGPRLFGSLVGAGLVDELFLTVSPQIAGRSADRPRLGLVEGLGYEAGSAPWMALSSVRRAGDYLFLRYLVVNGPGRVRSRTRIAAANRPPRPPAPRR